MAKEALLIIMFTFCQAVDGDKRSLEPDVHPENTCEKHVESTHKVADFNRIHSKCRHKKLSAGGLKDTRLPVDSNKNVRLTIL